jgi:C4-dicarboxylate transporter
MKDRDDQPTAHQARPLMQHQHAIIILLFLSVGSGDVLMINFMSWIEFLAVFFHREHIELDIMLKAASHIFMG